MDHIKKSMSLKELKAMLLHERVWICDGIMVMRVNNGWIYQCDKHVCLKSINGFHQDLWAVFVPE